MERRVEVVLWNDASSHEGWQTIKSASVVNGCPTLVCGFLLQEDPGSLVLSSYEDVNQESACWTLEIPKPMIMHRTHFKVEVPYEDLTCQTSK